jgi:hypothetical protein
MKNKKVVYALLILALVVWGIIFYRVGTTLSKDKPAAVAVNKAPVLAKQDTGPEDFKIVADYRDPFLGTAVREREKKKVVVKPVQKKAPVSTIQWPQIKLGGIIRTQSKQPLALVTINGKENIVKEKETILEVTLSKVYHDSAEFIYKNEKRIIRK